MMLGLALVATGGLSAHAERWPGTSATISGAIAARIIAVKCSGPLTPAEIGELDSYIDERQTAFMSESEANQRVGESVFPQLARDYNRSYSDPQACDADARDLVKDMLQRVRNAETDSKKRAELKD
jgi:hypothetical protein